MLGTRRSAVASGFGGLLVALAILGSASPAHSQGNIRVGQLRILPFLEVSGEYDDNVELAPPGPGKISDFIWTISPGVTVELPGPRYAVRAGFRADILEYTEHSTFNTVRYTGQLEGRYEFPWGLGLSFADQFLKTDDFAGFPVPEQNALVDRYQNTLNAGTQYQFADRWSAAVDYTNFWVEYLSGPRYDQFNRMDQQIALSLFYRIQPKTSILAEYDYQIIRYAENLAARQKDSDSNKLKVGVKGDLTSKTSVLLKVGGEAKDYTNPIQPDWTGLILEGEAIWRYAEPSQLRLYAARQNVESLFVTEVFYVSTYGGVELRHQIQPKLLLVVSGLVGTNEYPDETTIGTQTAKRSDLFYEIRAGLKYQIQRWLAVELGYGYLVLNSNFNQFDYTDNRVKLSVVLTY